jgi:AcrR family transcriptional regulator
MATTTRRSTDRRQEIIDAAFALAAVQPEWSLSDVASRIGVSKTALYRHFKNRAEIETLMDERLVDDIALAIETAGNDAPSVRAAVMRLFRDRQGYLYRVMVQSSENGDFAEVLTKRLVAKSARVAAFLSGFSSLPKTAKTALETTVIKNWISILIASYPVKDAGRLQEGLLVALERGIPSLAIPEDARLDGLDRVSAIEAGEAGERGRLFSAIAASIRVHGLRGTTIETIAEKMGTAKSSLYFYSPNKGDMLEGLLEHEKRTLVALCGSRAAHGTTLAEQIYVMMMTTANYVVANPDIAPAFNWIRYELLRDGTKAPPRDGCEDRSIEAYRFDELFPHDANEGKLYATLTLKWASILSVSCAIRGCETETDGRTIRKNVRLMFKSMMCGDGNRR